MFKPLNLFKTELTSVLEVDSTSLPIPASHAIRLCTTLGDECVPCGEEGISANFTRLVISYKGYYEIVKVISCAGNVPVIERGDECTTPLKFPIGACVYFIWTAANLECAIIQVASGFPLGDCPAGCGTIDLGEGVPGAEGPAGPEGPQGIPGEDGLIGDTGPIGPQGVAGPAGATGAQGLNGQDGINGSEGIQGVAGPAGTDGSQGVEGPIGPVGPAGVQGITGPAGGSGVDGASAYDYYVLGGGEQTEAEFAICLNSTCPPPPVS